MNSYVIEVGERSFQEDVIERSRGVPVLVDFWAPWCGPCRMLTPVLEQLAAEGNGSWVLAKVNSDENPRLAQRYDVRGIPNVKAFRDGKLVAEFVGAQPRAMVQRFLEQLLPNELDESVSRAEELLSAGKTKLARAALKDVLREKPDHDAAHLAMARVELTESDPQAALAHLDAIPAEGPLGPAAKMLRAQARFSDTQESSVQELAARIDENPADLDSRYELARLAVQRGDYDTAAEQLLYVIEKQRDFRDGAAHQAILDLFTIMGEDDPRTRQYRKKLGMLLFA
ncbi:MAG: thioredoxin [Ardenticatenaceae bacterium]